jgi:hypothetical protein
MFVNYVLHLQSFNEQSFRKEHLNFFSFENHKIRGKIEHFETGSVFVKVADQSI